MKSIIAWAIRNSPAMNTLLIASMLVGAVSFVVMRREVFPNFALEILLVSVPFPGATPDEVEEGICQKIESVVSGVEGVKKMTSVARENYGYLILELNSDVKDVQKVLNDVRSQVDQIASFPPRAEDPEVKQIVFRAPAIQIGILGPKPGEGVDPLEAEKRLRELAEEVRAEVLELRAVPPEGLARRMLSGLFQPRGTAISGADIVAERPYEIAVEVPEDRLRQYNLSIDGLAQLLRLQNVEMPGGKMETASQEVLLRGDNKQELGEEIAKIPILTQSNGDVVTVGEIGNVVDGFAETTSQHFINGRPGIAISVTKTNNEDLFTVVDAVQDYVAKKQNQYPGYEIKTWGNISEDVQDRIDLLSRNGMQGLVLVFLVLAIFLDLRLAFWVAIGIPVSVLGAGFVLLLTGQTLNMLTMFAFLMALGIVVDDAIVIGENIYTKRSEGLNFTRASIEGTLEVLPSVCASVATTIIAFLPLMFVTGVMGKFISVMPVAVIAMLVISLVESTFILPSHLAHQNNLFMKMVGLIFYIFKPLMFLFKKLNRLASGLMEWSIQRFYRPLLAYSLVNKPVVLSASLAYACVAVGLIAGGIAPFGFFPKLDSREISATVAFPAGTRSDFAVDAVAEMRDAVLEIQRERPAGSPEFIVNVYEKIGEIGNGMGGPTGVTNGSHVGTVQVQLVPADERDMKSDDLIAAWREKLVGTVEADKTVSTAPAEQGENNAASAVDQFKEKLAGSEVLKFGSATMGPGGVAIEFKLLADDNSIQYLEQAAEDCKVALAGIAGVKDIEDDSRLGKWEMVLRLNEQGKALGLNENSLANTIRTVYFGDEVMRLQRGRHEVKLMVRYPRSERETMESFENIRVRDNTGSEWPLLEVAEVDYQRASSEVNRLDQRRSITITADVDSTQGNAAQINLALQQEVLPEILADYREKGAILSVNWEGEQAQTIESMVSLFAGFFVALLCMYVLLTLEFRSYIQPLIILAIIPFGWLGAILGHALLGLQLTLFSFFGLIALTGVVVNDSIVLVDFINRRVREGLSLNEALMAAGQRRFRPIMLTSMTTIAGLFPILLETSLQAQVLIPMAASLIFGLATGTLLILILVPVFYSMYGGVLKAMNVSIDDDPHDESWSEDSWTGDDAGPQPALLTRGVGPAATT
ncbi:MAG: efflux RND transporter permease subunit [Planctomycetota bacterium]|nr:efflux RND transporter permease subunit [Planctomycetota bacterium]